jgi:predicted PurR-regulated permease PerM
MKATGTTGKTGYTLRQRMNPPGTKRFLKTEPLLGAVALLLLLLGCFFVLRHFLTALVWAMILTYSLFPLQKMFTRWFRGRRTLAACLVTLTVAIVISGPVVLIGMSLAKDGRELAFATRAWFMDLSDTPPTWIGKVPVVGTELDTYWKSFTEDRKRWMEQLDKEVKAPPPRPKIVMETDEGMIAQDAPPVGTDDLAAAVSSPADADTGTGEAKPGKSNMVALLGRFLTWARSGLLDAGIAVLGGVTQILISAFLAFFLLRDSHQLSERLTVAVERLAGDSARRLLKVAGDTVRGVIFGILGTAIAQAVIAGVGFWIANVPGAVLLSVLTFLFAVLPFGPPIIWVPASLWLFAQGKPGYGLFMALWGLLAISSVDNFLRPYLISQGNNMPYALVFCGVIGGALAFGLVGIFLGPTLLAVAFRLVDEWSSKRDPIEPESRTSDISALPSGP